MRQHCDSYPYACALVMQGLINRFNWREPGGRRRPSIMSSNKKSDALIVALAYKKRRLYVFSHSDPVAEAERNGDDDEAVILNRDVMNEPPDADDMLVASGGRGGSESKLGDEAILRTSMGDIHIRLFPNAVPRTIENFCGHAKSGYYDNVIFHRVIKGFMLQTGDPLGDGTGGESIWGGEFEDEFRKELRHDRPFTVSMANAGPRHKWIAILHNNCTDALAR